MSSLATPEYGWWKPFPRSEKAWLTLIIIAAVVLSAITIGWAVMGKQNVPVASYSVTPEAFEKQVADFTAKYQIAGVPGEVRVPPGQDAYVMARMWSFSPVLHLKAGQPYTIWLSAKDVLHGFSITGQNLNITAAPGHAYGIRLTPQQPGTNHTICNEYCGVGHPGMTGKII
ncbi:MAG: cytochrome C oxidase subunit II, partial [Dehalococcoidia bacterium]|nr:cytochrome C oxidase subunit II [Dehalococcoidia bacterium]